MASMATHESEIVTPVDLAAADGRVVNDAARGWSRRPLHRANLRGRWGRNKRWDYWLVLAGDVVLSVTYADVDYVGIADVWWADLVGGTTGGRAVMVPFGRGMHLPDVCGTAPLKFRRNTLDLSMTDDTDGTTHLRAAWIEADDVPGRLDISVGLPEGHESLNVVIPWSDRQFQFTSKHQARPAVGEVVVGDRIWAIGAQSGPAWGVLDVGRGRWPYSTRWNWGGGAGVTTDGSVIGLQLGGMWTEGTGATENGVVLDGRLTKLGNELQWEYDWDAPLQPWRVSDPSGQLSVELSPRFDKHSATNLGVLATQTHQVFGTWRGSFTADDGRTVAFDNLQGFAEESRSRW
jgi:hypothetical protein